MARGWEKVNQELFTTVYSEAVSEAQFAMLKGSHQFPEIITFGQSIEFGQFRKLIFQSRGCDIKSTWKYIQAIQKRLKRADLCPNYRRGKEDFEAQYPQVGFVRASLHILWQLVQATGFWRHRRGSWRPKEAQNDNDSISNPWVYLCYSVYRP
jgi:hypothetical protein